MFFVTLRLSGNFFTFILSYYDFEVKTCYIIPFTIANVTVHSVHSNVAKIHSRLPTAMEFWLIYPLIPPVTPPMIFSDRKIYKINVGRNTMITAANIPAQSPVYFMELIIP